MSWVIIQTSMRGDFGNTKILPLLILFYWSFRKSLLFEKERNDYYFKNDLLIIVVVHNILYYQTLLFFRLTVTLTSIKLSCQNLRTTIMVWPPPLLALRLSRRHLRLQSPRLLAKWIQSPLSGPLYHKYVSPGNKHNGFDLFKTP